MHCDAYRLNCLVNICILELALPAEVDPEAPLQRHPDDCKVYYNFNYPMTCGEGFAFHSEKLACVPEEEADC